MAYVTCVPDSRHSGCNINFIYKLGFRWFRDRVSSGSDVVLAVVTASGLQLLSLFLPNWLLRTESAINHVSRYSSIQNFNTSKFDIDRSSLIQFRSLDSKVLSLSGLKQALSAENEEAIEVNFISRC
ncbi:hypothetical protein J6590_038968 [Homalodisca vitripennis]|nr:hypothetical protein J6590_066808 [Homalodisca vitripennis]KAG8265656.1 hypothetical protein J6590_090058 [Homalodisca vitripennis]KAG8292484.1 hypothetical protein J6590_038968 [Homalodisca vitripennis]